MAAVTVAACSPHGSCGSLTSVVSSLVFSDVCSYIGEPRDYQSVCLVCRALHLHASVHCTHVATSIRWLALRALSNVREIRNIVIHDIRVWVSDLVEAPPPPRVTISPLRRFDPVTYAVPPTVANFNLDNVAPFATATPSDAGSPANTHSLSWQAVSAGRPLRRSERSTVVPEVLRIENPANAVTARLPKDPRYYEGVQQLELRGFPDSLSLYRWVSSEVPSLRRLLALTVCATAVNVEDLISCLSLHPAPRKLYVDSEVYEERSQQPIVSPRFFVSGNSQHAIETGATGTEVLVVSYCTTLTLERALRCTSLRHVTVDALTASGPSSLESVQHSWLRSLKLSLVRRSRSTSIDLPFQNFPSLCECVICNADITAITGSCTLQQLRLEDSSLHMRGAVDLPCCRVLLMGCVVHAQLSITCDSAVQEGTRGKAVTWVAAKGVAHMSVPYVAMSPMSTSVSNEPCGLDD